MREPAVGTFGAASASHSIAAQVAVAMLERGGNAFDGAVAAGFVHHVVEPHQCGPGGEVVILAAPGGAEQPRVICGQGTAPAAATIARYRAEGCDVIPSVGLLAAVVPGAVDAWLLLLRDYGRLSLQEVLEPAIAYAINGFPVYHRFIHVVTKGLEYFKSEWSSSAALYLPGGNLPRLGTLFRNPMLGETYRRLLKEAAGAGPDRVAQIEAARRAFYRGFVADSIGKFCAASAVRDNMGRRHTGLLTAQDMADWQATYDEPVSYEYNGLTVYKPGAWSQGPVMLQCLALLRQAGLSEMDPVGSSFVHQLVEASKLAFADREAWYGDSSGVKAPLDILLSDEYNAARRRLIGAEASDGFAPGSINGVKPRLPAFGVLAPGERPRLPPAAALGAGDTCHLDVVDRWGNFVSATPSGGWLNDSPVIPELGFPLGTRAQMFWLQEGLPSSLAPGKRPRTTLSPTLAYRDGTPCLAFGARGADMQDQWNLQFFLRHVDCGWELQEAIDGLSFHSNHAPLSTFPRKASPKGLVVHRDYPARTIHELRERGHSVEMAPNHEWNFSAAAARREGVVSAVSRSTVREAGAAGR